VNNDDAASHLSDRILEDWSQRRADEGPIIGLIELYEMIADARNLTVEDISHDERTALASRALAVMWPGFEQVAPLYTDGRVEVVVHNEEWPEIFAQLESDLRNQFGRRDIRIEHIGSTAVPGLAAKPIIDVMICVEDLAAEERYVPQISSLGFLLYTRDDVHRFFLNPHRYRDGLRFTSVLVGECLNESTCCFATTCETATTLEISTLAKKMLPPRSGPMIAMATPTRKIR